MTARKAPTKAPTKAPPRKRPRPTPLLVQPEDERTPEERLTVLEQNYAVLRSEHDAIKRVIEQAILAQIQQQLATNPQASGILAGLLAQQNGASHS